MPAMCLLLYGIAANCALGKEPLPATADAKSEFKNLVEANCLTCHDQETHESELSLESILNDDVGDHTDAWEKVVRKLTAREMPPKDSPHPSGQDYDAAVAWLESALDNAASRKPTPGRTESLRRLNRTEYENAIRDLLALDVDASALLPADESSHGFDNITVVDLPPTLLNRYVSAARKISCLAVGSTAAAPQSDTFRIRPDVTQDSHVEGLPIGTRGGALIQHHFAQDGEYEVQVRLMRDRNEKVEGLTSDHELEILLDGERVTLLPVKHAKTDKDDDSIDAGLHARFSAAAGPHAVGITFLKKSNSLSESTRQPLNVHFNSYRHPRQGPAIFEVSIVGPVGHARRGESPSRQRIFICQPTSDSDEIACAQKIFQNLARHAYRRPATDDDLKTPLHMFREARAAGDFDAGIEAGLSSILVNPQFLFRIERDPLNSRPGEAYQISDLELASRISFFLWSSIPDDELIDLAERGELSRADVLERQTQRMLADPRAHSLTTNFAGQWLYLRNLDSANPDMRLYPNFDDNLRQSMRIETEMFFDSIVREDRNVLDLIRSDYTFLNERLARHYGVPNVVGSQFRRVEVCDAGHGSGLLRQASILTVTSYPTRTSPVLRGQWVLKNIIGMPLPPPPPNVPALKDNVVSEKLTLRERLSQHRTNEACASCHDRMDPVGFALENFDAVGRWRENDGDNPIDSAGSLPGGSEFRGVDGLEQALLERPELFVRTLTEKLLTFAIGRGIEYYDAPAVRKIVRDARDDHYRFSRLVVGIVRSTPFQMRSSP